MSSKSKKSLASALKDAKMDTIHQPHASSKTAKENTANTRQGRKAVITYLPQQIHTRLKIMAAQKNTTIQALSEEAFQLLFNN